MKFIVPLLLMFCAAGLLACGGLHTELERVYLLFGFYVALDALKAFHGRAVVA